MKKVTLLLLLSGLCFSVINAQPSEKTKIIKEYFDLYNNHNIEKLIDMTSDNFRMYSVSRDTTTLDIDGKRELQKWLTGYFDDLPNVSSEPSGFNVSGDYVSFIETAHWGEGKSQISLAVYEVIDGKINRAWYYY